MMFHVDDVERLILAGSPGLSALAAIPDEPRALVVAVHGGGMQAAYFHPMVDPGSSFLLTARRNGFAALAVDRPGYGAAAELQLPIEEQADCLWDAVDGFRAERAPGCDVFLLGHSMGSMVSIAMAAASGHRPLAGLAVSGVGARYHPDRLRDLARLRDLPPSGGVGSRLSGIELWWGGRDLYPPGALDRGVSPVVPVSAADKEESRRWSNIVGELASRCRVPVQIVFGDRDRWWPVGRDGLDEVARLFTGAPWMDVVEQRSAGHNLGLGYSAAPYNLRVLAFAEDCLLGQRRRRSD